MGYGKAGALALAMMSAVTMAAAPALADQPIYRFKIGGGSGSTGPTNPGGGTEDPGPVDPENPGPGQVDIPINYGGPYTIYEGTSLQVTPVWDFPSDFTGEEEINVNASPAFPAFYGAGGPFGGLIPMNIAAPIGSAGTYGPHAVTGNIGARSVGGSLSVTVLANPTEDGLVTVRGKNQISEGEEPALAVGFKRVGSLDPVFSLGSGSTVPSGVFFPMMGTSIGAAAGGSAGSYTFSVIVYQDLNGDGEYDASNPWTSDPFTLVVTPATSLTARVLHDGSPVAEGAIAAFTEDQSVYLPIETNPGGVDNLNVTFSPALPAFFAVKKSFGTLYVGQAEDPETGRSVIPPYGTYGPFVATVTDAVANTTAQTQAFRVGVVERQPPAWTPPGSGCRDFPNGSSAPCKAPPEGTVVLSDLRFVNGTQNAPETISSGPKRGVSSNVTVQFTGGSGLYVACFVPAPVNTGTQPNRQMCRQIHGSRGGVSSLYPEVCSTPFAADPEAVTSASFFQKSFTFHEEGCTEAPRPGFDFFRGTVVIQDVNTNHYVNTSGTVMRQPSNTFAYQPEYQYLEFEDNIANGNED